MKKLYLVFVLVLSCLQMFAQEQFSIGVDDLRIYFEVKKNHMLEEKLLVPFSGKTDDMGLSISTKKSSFPVAIHVTGEDRAEHHGAKLCGGIPGKRIKYEKHEEIKMPWGKRYIVSLKDDPLELLVELYYDFYEGTNTCRRYTKVTNQSKKSIGIDYLSSAMINNTGNLGNGTIDEKLMVHWNHSSWYAEGQWLSQKPSELGWGENGMFQLSGIFHTNLGSWSTIKEIPMAMVENKAVGLTWFWQIEHNGSWHWEFSNIASGPTEISSPTYIYLGGPDEEHHQAWKQLNPGEVYQSVPVAIGCVTGSFEEGVAALTKYRRTACLSPHPDNKNCPVIFNDYMNCLSGDPTTEKELPLIDAASKAGCDYFVIDAGWYAERKENWWAGVGLWKPGISRFPNGIEEVIDSIKTKKMIPGLWLEIERVGTNSPLKDKPDNWFFLRHGKRVIEHSSFLLDFRNRKVRDYADEVVDRLVNTYGAGYIKMDYNVNALMGTELGANSMGQGLLDHQRAYQSWMRQVYKRHPELVIENCGSGGCRMDYAMLSMHQLQSSSDQTDYWRYPAILTGVMAAVLPEQLAVWSYPLRNGDKYEASFNMVNAMLCRVHQSGHLSELPAESFTQVKNGIGIYKKELAPKISESIPFFPLGMPSLSDKVSPVALGIEHEEADYYAVWRLSGSNTVRIDLKNNGKAEILYPDDLGINLSQGSGVFTVSFPKTYMAVIVKVVK